MLLEILNEQKILVNNSTTTAQQQHNNNSATRRSLSEFDLPIVFFLSQMTKTLFVPAFSQQTPVTSSFLLSSTIGAPVNVFDQSVQFKFNRFFHD